MDEFAQFLIDKGICPECMGALFEDHKECSHCGWPDIQRCRVCGCTHYNPCDGGCWWVEDDLCSACAVGEEGEEKDNMQ